MIKDDNITALPAIIFSHNQWLDSNMVQYLTALPSWKFSLGIDAKFNPFAQRSDRGLLMLDPAELAAIKTGAYIDWNSDAKISWIEYSDLECPFCAKLHTEGTPETVKARYGDDINIVFQHFPLGFHANAKPGAEITECLADQKGSEAFYAVIEKSFAAGNSTKSFLLDGAVALGWDRTALEECLDAGTHWEKVDTQMARGTRLFWVTGTPGNVLINNETGEYEVLSGAYPAASFEQIIDKLK
jgi:protein-disulfide isomerase